MGGPSGPPISLRDDAMQRIPLPFLRVGDDSLATEAVVSGPSDSIWATYEQAFGADLNLLAHDLGETLCPGALRLADVAYAESAMALGLIQRGRHDLADWRRTQVLRSVRAALECYARDRMTAGGRVTGLTVLPTESHHGARRPILIRTERDGAWMLKERPAAGEQEILGPDGAFALLNVLSQGTIRLPLLEIERSSELPDLSWQRYVAAPESTTTIDGVVAAQIGPDAARATWLAAGWLAGACAALGVTDLGEDNVLTREHAGMLELLPIDTELLLHPGMGLHRTMLTRDGRASSNHHTGIETSPRACTGGGPIVHVNQSGAVVRRDRSCRRTSSRSLIANSDGSVGYARSLTDFVRGIVDAWVVTAQHRDAVASTLHEKLPRTRYLTRPTAIYTDALAAWLAGEVEDPCHALMGDPPNPQEAAQLRDGDVPYLVRDVDSAEIDRWRDGLTLSSLGPVVRDAVEYVRDALPALSVDVGTGVHILLTPHSRQGRASVTLPGSDRIIVFTWDDSRVRLELPEPRAALPDEFTDRLLRIQRTDGHLRNLWTATEFTDDDLRVKLDRLTASALTWLEDVIRHYGWPGADLVGEDAARAAAQLVQHATDADRQGHLVDSMLDAALLGRVAWADMAGALDSLAVLRKQPQFFGTKFEKGPDGSLRPYQLADPARIEDIRSAAGLEPLDDYRARLNHYLTQQSTEGVNR
ncbi:DUF6624 domain-containing protein [Demetria terragena]|uniref:DUF6624 domain-containing protein n=1 Tax=Demetria terragena TaxID=63959 RepID=UPI00035FF734|nr:DUF6624 domain-containing protein [Demetria terragena]